MSTFLPRLLNNRHFKNGIPFFLFIFGGGFALKEFRTVRYDSELNPKQNKNLITIEEAFGDKSDKIELRPHKATLEEDLEVLKEKVDLDNWENKRGPRPWEEGSIPERPIVRVNKSPITVKELISN